MTLKIQSIPHWEDGATNIRGHNCKFFLTALKYKIDSSHPVSPLFITWHKSWQSFFYIPGTALTREHSVSYKMSHWLHSNWKLCIHDTSSGPIFPLIGACPKFTVHWRILRDHKFALMTLSEWKNILIDMIPEFLTEPIFSSLGAFQLPGCEYPSNYEMKHEASNWAAKKECYEWKNQQSKPTIWSSCLATLLSL